jgi:hypothetical protein
LDQAIAAYYRERVLTILNQVKITPEKQLVKDWEALLQDMHGEDKAKNMDVFNLILQMNEMSEDSKNWVKKYMKEHGYRK